MHAEPSIVHVRHVQHDQALHFGCLQKKAKERENNAGQNMEEAKRGLEAKYAADDHHEFRSASSQVGRGRSRRCARRASSVL